MTIGQGQTAQNDPWIPIILIALSVAVVCLLTAIYTKDATHHKIKKIHTFALIWAVGIAFAILGIVTIWTFLANNG
jgi:uncharacterized membrane protein YoaK (UPF0700 family)